MVDSLDEAVQYANEYAPEHLEINVEDPDALIPKLVNYGSLFIGQNTAEVFGDYASGTNHTLPTLRAARYTGGVWVGTFLKTCTHQSMTPEASARIAPLVSRMAHGRIIWTCSGCGCKKIGKIENNRIKPSDAATSGGFGVSKHTACHSCLLFRINQSLRTNSI